MNEKCKAASRVTCPRSLSTFRVSGSTRLSGHPRTCQAMLYSSLPDDTHWHCAWDLRLRARATRKNTRLPSCPHLEASFNFQLPGMDKRNFVGSLCARAGDEFGHRTLRTCLLKSKKIGYGYPRGRCTVETSSRPVNPTARNKIRSL